MTQSVAVGSEQLKAGIREDLPELELITDAVLREKVVDAWAMALSQTEYTRISEIPCEGNPGEWVMKGATQADHLRGVARTAYAMATEIESVVGPFGVDRELVLAAALVHDVGKPYEFSPRNRERWQANPGERGLPAVRHPVYGVHIAMSVGLPERIVHVVGAHSMYSEGQFVKASTECTIVQYADHAFWKVLERAGRVVQ